MDAEKSLAAADRGHPQRNPQGHQQRHRARKFLVRRRLDLFPELAHWKPDEPGLGAPVDWHYIEREAARFFNYTMGGWLREDRLTQADVIAHYQEHNRREGYAMDRAKQAARRKAGSDEEKAAPPRPWQRFGKIAQAIARKAKG